MKQAGFPDIDQPAGNAAGLEAIGGENAAGRDHAADPNHSADPNHAAGGDVNHVLLDLCLRFGVMMLEVGAETSRVEDSINRILTAYGYLSPSAFAIPALVLVTFKDQEGQIYTSSYRVKSSGNNLDRLSSLNQLSRTLCEGEPKSPAFFHSELERIAATPNHSLPVVLAASVVISFAFVILFQGRPEDMLAAGIAAVFTRYVFILLSRAQVNSIFTHMFSSFIAGFVVELLFRLGLGSDPAVSTISVIMNLVPGMLLTNGIRETINGDFNSGMNKMAEALLISVVLAVGTGAALLLVRR